MTAVRGAHGKGKDDAGAKIWIENVRLLHRLGPVATVTYKEWQREAGKTRGRLSTVLFQIGTDDPAGVEWIHVHEVWLPE